MSSARIVVRVLIGLFMLYAGAEKVFISGQFEFAESIINYQLTSDWLAFIMALVLPWLEIFVGLALITGMLMEGGILLATGMLVAFTAAVISALARGLDIDCGCFSIGGQANKVGFVKITENAVAIGALVFLWVTGHARSGESSRPG